MDENEKRSIVECPRMFAVFGRFSLNNFRFRREKREKMENGRKLIDFSGSSFRFIKYQPRVIHLTALEKIPGRFANDNFLCLLTMFSIHVQQRWKICLFLSIVSSSTEQLGIEFIFMNHLMFSLQREKMLKNGKKLRWHPRRNIFKGYSEREAS